MTSTALPHPENSTTVRSNKPAGPASLRWRTGAQRVALKALSVLAPPLAEELAVLRFGTPSARLTHSPEVPGAARTELALRVEHDELAVYIWGEGPAVLLVHGFGGSAAQLTRFVPPLLAAGYSVVAFDQPAHGRSSGHFTHLMQLARAVRAVAERFGAKRVIAHSLGATATAIAHAQGLPLERAALIAPPGNVPYFASAFAQHAGLPAARLPGMLRRLERMFGVPLAALDVERLHSDEPAALLVVHDAQDQEVPYAHGRALAAHWPGAELHTVHALGHRRVLRDAAVIGRTTHFVSQS